MVYHFPLGKKGTLDIGIDEQKGLCWAADVGGTVHSLSLDEGVFCDRFECDVAISEMTFCKAFHRDASVICEDNRLTVTSHPIYPKTGAALCDITVINRFTVCTDCAAVVQETFYEQARPRYDTAPGVGRAKIEDLEQYDTIDIPEWSESFPIGASPALFAHCRGLALRGKNRYIKAEGGLVMLDGNMLEAHTGKVTYMDDLSFFDAENPLVTVYSFEEGARPALPKRRPPQKTAEGRHIMLTSGRLTADLIYTDTHLGVWLCGRLLPLAALRLRSLADGCEIYVNTLSRWEQVSTAQRDNQTELILRNPEGLCGITLRLSAVADAANDKISWTVAAENESDTISVLWCSYPYAYASAAEPHHLFSPGFGGEVLEGLGETDRFTCGAYPSGFLYPMPYYALYRPDAQTNGLYYAIHDASGAKKDMSAAGTQTGTVRMGARFYAENYGLAANTNRLPGTAVWQLFDGDWFEAGELYRTFLEAECFWYQNASLDKTPQWMRDLPFWIMDWVPPEDGERLPTNLRTDGDEIRPDDWFDNALLLRKELDVPIGYHIYGWHQIPFNNDYPHFLPPRKRFLDKLPQLKAAGIRVMPYINALLWDTKDGGNADFEFETLGRPGAVKRENGEPQHLCYESRESDGSLVQLAPMCPSYEVWRQKLVRLTTALFCDYGVDAVYLDQIAARIPHLCMDSSHGHPLGGGAWWCKNYNELLAELNAHKPADKVFTTESNAEVYAAQIDGFLSWAWIRAENGVPAFMQLYGDRCLVLGRNTNGYIKPCDLHWKYHLAQALVCGQQLGWINSDVVHNKARLAFLKKLVRFRWENRSLFKGVRILHPPHIGAAPADYFTAPMGMQAAGVLHKPYISAGALQNGKRTVLPVVNIAARPVTCILTLPKGMKCGRLTATGDGTATRLGEQKIECSVQGESLICIELEEA